MNLLHGLFLTVHPVAPAEDETAEPNRLCVILSDGTPQLGHDPVTVLTLETFPLGTPHTEIQAWRDRMIEEMPWETRQ